MSIVNSLCYEFRTVTYESEGTGFVLNVIIRSWSSECYDLRTDFVADVENVGIETPNLCSLVPIHQAQTQGVTADTVRHHKSRQTGLPSAANSTAIEFALMIHPALV
jgi:hypothetical protein